MGKGKMMQALHLAGSQHKYQKILVFLIAFLWIQINYVMIGPTLIYMDPLFHCLSTGDIIVSEQHACIMINQCTIIEDFTLTAQMQLYCDREWARNIIQSIFSIGAFVGLIIMNMISDTMGRKIATMITMFVIFIGVSSAFIGGYFEAIPLLIIAQFLCGFGSYACVTLGYTLLSDFCNDTFRPKAVVIINSAWGFSTTSLGIYYLAQIDWKTYLIFITLIPLICLSIIKYIYIYESPFILVNQNKKQQALQVLIKIAQLNGKQQNIQKITQIVKAEQVRNEQTEASLQNVVNIVKQWKYLKQIILLTVIYGLGNLNFYSIAYAFDMEGQGFGYNSIIAGCVQMGSFLYLSWLVNKIQRKKGIIIFYSVCAIIGLSFLIPAIQNSQTTQTLLLGTSRIFGTIAYTLVACMQVQAFTVEIQSTAAGLIEAFSLYGGFIAPLLVDFAQNLQIDPVALVSMILIFVAVPTYSLRQTLVKGNQEPLLEKQQQNQYVQYISSSKKSILTNDE